MYLDCEIHKHLIWWINNIEKSSKPILTIEPSMILQSDSSKTGWGGLIKHPKLAMAKTGGHWSYHEQDKHINVLELLAAFLTLKSFCATKNNIHIKIYLDNTYNWKSTPESGRRQGNIDIDSTNIHDSTMVCKNSSSDSRTILHTTKEKSVDSSIRSFKAASFKENAVSSVSFIRTRLNSFGLPTDTTNILYDSWRNSTKKQYGSYLNKWVQFCVKRQINSFKASNSIVLQFLTELFQKGLGYSAINTARSALSSVLDCGKVNPIGNDPLICRFMKGVYNKRPTLPRYEVTWDVDVMLKFLCTLSPVNMLTLKNLTLKLTMILSLLTAQRTQTLHLMDINDITVNNDELIIKVTKLIKTSKPGSHLSDIHLPAYNKDKSLCVVDTFNEYIKRTKSLRGQYTKLFIMTMKPHKPVSKTL
ncbi:unnamed protein product [Mytilus edulis]|uniref:Core-binding (CB) domain-containing protein n=1 Tax=Mytilus edulis TaxID=6550 RepID=A0A8S3UTA2_MYTED|nr:unnamed protein product [Mytilus edulis]